MTNEWISEWPNGHNVENRLRAPLRGQYVSNFLNNNHQTNYKLKRPRGEFGRLMRGKFIL